MLDIIIVIPTYWTWPSEQANGPVDAAYDHPTPLDGESTLPRLLDSLMMLDGPPFSVLVLTAAVHRDLEELAAQQVEALMRPYRQYFPITQFAAADLKLLRERVAAVDFDPSLVDLRDYASVRNCQLIIPHLMGSEVVVALDDDEVVKPDYLRVATEFIGKERSGIGGFYLDREGDMFLPEGEPKGNPFLDKSALMNEGTRALQAIPGRLVPTPVVLGGNMVFHRSLWERVSFDPWITRGEDIDYLINARLHGYEFYLDKELSITHMPPENYGALPYAKLAQDIVRFLYERGKLLAARDRPGLVAVEPQDLNPYPGRLLQENLVAQALAALQHLATPDAVARHGSPEQIVEQATQWAREAPLRYFEFAQKWHRLLAALDRDPLLRGHWNRTEI
jgi:hypothetical protein